MTDIDTQLIELNVCKFRRALENCPKNLLPISFERFPIGSCGDATLLLGKYLQKKGFGDFDYILGESGTHSDDTWHSHAWLQKGELIIDITADQFADFEQPVIVTINSPWHKKYRIKDVHPADYEIYDDYTKATLAVAFHSVCKFLEQTSAYEDK